MFRGKTFCNVPAKTYRRDQVPQAFHETGILTGYRNPTSSWRECIASAFRSHNETLNVWTHIIPCLYVIYTAVKFHQETIVTERAISGGSGGLLWDDYYRPLLLLYISSAIYLGGSASAHLLNTMSESYRHLSFCFDYAFISLYSYCSICAFRAYSYPASLRHGIYYNNAQTIAVLYNVFACAAKCESRLGAHPTVAKLSKVCTTSFSYVLAMGPVLARMYLTLGKIPVEDPHTAEEWFTQWSDALSHHGFSFLSAITAVLIYSLHLPEVLFPGRFDVIGHSHQVFHVFIALMTTEQLRGIHLDIIADRHYNSVNSASASSVWETFGIFVCLVAALLSTMAIYQNKIHKYLNLKSK